MFELMDDISELVYVADLETHDLLYVNNAGKEFFHLDELSPGMKCHKVLQGLDEPCPFCTNGRLSLNEYYTWEYTNPVIGRHYLLKDRIIEWEGKRARLEIAFDITASENEKTELKNNLDAQRMVMECVRLLYRKKSLEAAFPAVLEMLGTYLSAERTYVFEVSGNTMSNTFEWCSEHTVAQIENLQELDLSLLGRWRTFFDRHECVIIEDIEDVKPVFPDEYATLKPQGIQTLVAAPLEYDGELLGYIGVDNPPPEKVRNISPLLQTLCYFLMVSLRRENDQQLMARLSYYDTLTGLYNRNRYTEDMERLSGGNEPVGIAYLDINGLKDLNDQFGHEYGDETLVECARKMKAVFENANYYRIGGDEFVVLALGLTEEQFHKKIRVLRRAFSGDPRCRAAIGCKWEEKAESLQQLISAADARMYEDKKRFYRGSLSNRYRHNNDDILDLTSPEVLRRHLSNNRFVVYLQPKVSFDDRSAVGAEALVRYRTEENSILLPGHFLPILEDSRLIGHVDFYVFEFACSKIREWIANERKAVPISVNFSRYSLTEPGFVSHLEYICDEYGISHDWLEIEITESVEEMADLNLKELIEEIRSAGFAVSIDDFGTHYANLSLLSSIDFDVLKLDKSLVDDIVGNSKARSVIAALVDICQKMNIRVLAEGIETEEQFRILREMGLGQAQGYLFSRPIPLEEYEDRYL